MNFFKNTNIGIRITLAIIIPIVGMTIFSGITVLEKNTAASEMARIQELAELAPIISSTVHELQKERGASAVFISSKGAKFTKELPEQRKGTDEKNAALAKALDALDAEDFSPALAAKVKAAREALKPLNSKRKEIAGLEITVPQMASYYTPTIAKLLAIVEEMPVLSTNAEVTNAITAYTHFLQGKERAGIERAMGAGGFSAGKFKPGIYRKFLQLVAMQDTFLKTFNNYASAEQKNFRESTITGEAVDEVERMRKIAIESPVTGSTEGIEGPYWFNTITKKIDLLKKVEDKVAGDLQALAGSIQSSAQSTFFTMSIVTAILLVVTVLLVVYIVRGITGPIGDITEGMTKLAEGDKTVKVGGTERGDEIGRMAQAVQVFKENALKMDKMAEEQKEAEHRAEEEKKKSLAEMADDFESQIGGIVNSVASASEEMKATAESMSQTAEQTSNRANSAASASDQASGNVQTVAAAAEELSSSINEISRQVSESTQIAQQAVEEATRTNASVESLAEAAGKIGDVVALITDIAEQTNLLALNATIEAARAGDAGKGFAVVANEVKSLANQTAKATDEIGSQIKEMQSATQQAVEAIAGISTTIGKISEITTTISSAVEEQGSATQEIARNVQDASSGSAEVSSNISEVNQAAEETGQAAQSLLGATGELSKQAETLRGEVSSFLSKVRSS